MKNTANDGLLTTEDQILGFAPHFGIDLGILEADHIELVVSGFVSRANKIQRRAFTRALLQTIYQDPTLLITQEAPRTYWQMAW